MFDGTVTHADDWMCRLCGKDAQEEVEVGMLVFKHVAVDFIFPCVDAVLFEAASCAMWGKCG